MPASERLARVFSIIVLTSGCLILAWNGTSGGMIEGGYGEYMRPTGIQGSGKWRTSEGQAFQTFCLLFAPFVYLTAVPNSLLLAWRSLRCGERLQRARYLALAAANLRSSAPSSGLASGPRLR